MSSVIMTDSLTKQYGEKAVVNKLDLKVPSGSIYGFLGPNGAGKSTTLKLLLGLIKPTEGHMKLLGREVNTENRLAILSQTGSLIESPAYYGHLSGKENLRIVCTLKDVPFKEIDRVLEIVRMTKQQNKKVSKYSLGMKQRLGLAAALLGAPKLLLLDEPTNGLDPAGIQEMRELICSLPEQYGMSVVVSSHLLSEIDQMATHAGIIDHGQLIFQDSLSSLHEHSKSRIILHTDNDSEALKILKQLNIPAIRKDGSLLLKVQQDALVAKTIASLVHGGIGILRVYEQQMSLEDIFLHLTGKQVSL
ncbi:ABC transporter ATP-binding protein [Lachnospiraceae bacterium MD308]|nr:ABC transporter ATP-binding protein [Lachnospiraceae bacterium MD308]MCI8581228.1 ABC transporter ATP-binding protein [Dorea sp.]